MSYVFKAQEHELIGVKNGQIKHWVLSSKGVFHCSIG